MASFLKNLQSIVGLQFLQPPSRKRKGAQHGGERWKAGQSPAFVASSQRSVPVRVCQVGMQALCSKETKLCHLYEISFLK